MNRRSPRPRSWQKNAQAQRISDKTTLDSSGKSLSLQERGSGFRGSGLNPSRTSGGNLCGFAPLRANPCNSVPIRGQHLLNSLRGNPNQWLETWRLAGHQSPAKAQRSRGRDSVSWRLGGGSRPIQRLWPWPSVIQGPVNSSWQWRRCAALTFGVSP